MGALRVLAVAALAVSTAERAVAQAVPPLTAAEQVATAVLAAPEDLRAGATVMGYDAGGRLTVLREGSNDLICVADDPAVERFEVSCHHRSVEPYIARGRELRAQGVTGAALNQVRWKEMEEGRLALPEKGASNYILAGTYDTATGQVRDGFLRWVVYTPYATPASTGLSTSAQESAPWLMFAGTPGSHIMIVPPRPRDGR